MSAQKIMNYGTPPFTKWHHIDTLKPSLLIIINTQPEWRSDTSNSKTIEWPSSSSWQILGEGCDEGGQILAETRLKPWLSWPYPSIILSRLYLQKRKLQGWLLRMSGLCWQAAQRAQTSCMPTSTSLKIKHGKWPSNSPVAGVRANSCNLEGSAPRGDCLYPISSPFAKLKRSRKVRCPRSWKETAEPWVRIRGLITEIPC